MSQRLTLKNIRDDLRIAPVLNVCGDDARIPGWLNNFQEKAWQRGRWWGSTQLVRFCITDCCVVLPREVAVIEAAKLDGVPLGMGNSWYQFIKPHDPCDNGTSSSGAPCTGPSLCSCCGCSHMTMEDRGTVASPSVTSGTNNRIRFYPGNAVDVGKKIIVQGYDNNGNWVRSTVGGVRVDGEEVTLALPFVDTVTIWNPGAPTGIIKDPTEYPVLMYAVDATSGDEVSLASYQPSETNPMYRMVNIPGCNSGCSSNGTKTLMAIVSLQHIPITADNDWLMFSNLSAYKAGMMAEKYYEEGNFELGDAYFFGNPRPSRNGRGILRHTFGMGALPMLEAELRRMTGDVTSINVQYSTLNLAGFM